MKITLDISRRQLDWLIQHSLNSIKHIEANNPKNPERAARLVEQRALFKHLVDFRLALAAEKAA